MSPIFAIAQTGQREAIRNRVTVVVAAFSIALIFLTSMVMSVTIYSIDKVVTDFGLGVMSLLLSGLAIFMSVGMLSRELERRTVFLVMSRPISRGQFVVGRYLGVVVTLAMLQAVMGLIYGLQLLVFSVPWSEAIAAAMVGLFLELCVLSALGILFSSFSGTVTSTVCVVALYLVGHWAPDLHALSTAAESPLVSRLLLAVYYVVPNLDRLDFKPHASYAAYIGRDEWLTAGATGLGWSVVFIAGAALLFRRRDFK